MRMFRRSPARESAVVLPDANPTQQYFLDGFLRVPLANTDARERFLRVLGDLQRQGPRAGFTWEQKYQFSRDLRPTAHEYDAAILDVLFESRIPASLKEATGLDLCLAHIQVRVTLPGSSYMDWHRDTHMYGGRVAGNIPPIHKLIIYPTLGATSRPQLLVAPGTHRRVLNDEKSDLAQGAKGRQVTVESSDAHGLLFDTSLLHAVPAETDPAGSMRIIYAFAHDFQLAAFTTNKSLQDAYRARLAKA
jgi:hypothetical protein